MDPFNKLPAEIRVQIYLQLRLHSKHFIRSIAQASPAMLTQYITSKASIIKMSLASDLDEEMIQDATRIILFSSWKTTIDYSDVADIYGQHSWTAEQLPNPLKTGDHTLISKIDKLHSMLLLLIEDYITKATAEFPPREYLCLPDLSTIHGHLIFKDQIVSPRFNAVHLTNQERRRFLRAFLRRELMHKVYHWQSCVDPRLDWSQLREYGGQAFKPSEQEAINCVDEYLVSLYAALFAQCGDDCWLPDIPEGTLSHHNTGLLYPDNIYVDAGSYASDMGRVDNRAPNPKLLENSSFFGLDLIMTLLQYATSGRHERDRLNVRFKYYYHGTSSPTSRYPNRDRSQGSNGESEDGKQMCVLEGPGMYQMLCHLIEPNLVLQHKIFRQRAWAFFDDARLYPLFGLEHFPTSDELEELRHETGTHDKWFSNPRHTRSWHRSQSYHGPRRPSVDNNQSHKGRQTPLPSLPPPSGDGYLAPLVPFWLYGGL